MVEEIVKNGRVYFACPLCGMAFRKRKLAEHCEKRCNEGRECHGKMIRHSVQL